MASPCRRYTFGRFVLVPDERLLLREGRPVSLTPRAFDVLAYLVAQPGHLVSKEELFASAWPGVVVEENALAVAISRLRSGLGDDGRGLIETVPGRGYRFAAPVTVLDDDADAAAGGADAGARTPATSPNGGASRDALRRLNPRRRTVFFAAVGLASAVVLLGAFALRSGRRQPTPTAHEPSMEAVQAYQRGREMWEARDDALYLILQEYKRAAALDPRFARAHLGQGQVYAFMYGSGTEAETAISRALELDPSLGEAWATRAFVRAFQHWDWVGAEAAFARALALDPENATTLQWLANVRMVQRRFPEARALLTRAITRAPEYGVLHADLCELHYYLRDLEAARAACRRAAALSPDVTFIYRNLQYIELLDREGDSHARRRLSTEDRQAFDSTTRARMWARIGQRDSTLGMVELAVAERAFIAPFLNADPHFDFVRGDPRWQRAMARMGL